jgi:hypothetical protein
LRSVRQEALMSPARDSMRTPSGALTSSDRVGDSNLHQQTQPHLYDVTLVTVIELVSTEISLHSFSSIPHLESITVIQQRCFNCENFIYSMYSDGK